MIKKTFSKVFSNRIACAVLSVLIAFCLWLYVVGVENMAADFTVSNIPVTFEGEDGVLADRGLMISAGKEVTVDLKLRTPRTVMSKLDRKNITLTVDVSGIISPGEYTRVYNIVWPTTVSESDITIVSRSTVTVEFTVARQASKTVPLRGVLAEGCVVAEGYIAKEFEFDPKEITIQGPEELINQVEEALVTISRTNISETIDMTAQYVLLNAAGEQVDTTELIRNVEEVNVRLPILMQKQIWLRVELKDGGGATEDDARVNIEPKYIVVAGDPETLSTYNSITLAAIDLSEIISSYSETLPIMLVNGIENVSGETEAHVSVSLEGLATRSIDVTAFEFKNVPEGYDAVSETKTLKVNIRGDAQAVEQILESNLVAVADLSGMAEGTMSVPVEIQINSKTTAGVVGSYSIYVRIGVNLQTETAEEEEP